MGEFKMIDEIHETPNVMDRLVANESEKIKEIASELKRLSPSVIVATGRGTSDNACIYGQYLFGSELSIPVALALGSLYTHYKRPPTLKNGVVIGISQSGETEDVCEILKQSIEQKTFTIGITNNLNSTMAKLLKENTIFMNAGKEESVAATKTFNASITTIAMLVYSMKEKPFDVKELKDIYDYIFKKEMEIESIAQKYTFAKDIIVLGTGFNYSIALESALKLKETCYISAQGLSSVDFVHGPMAILDPNIPVIIFAPDDSTLDLSLKVIEKIKNTGSHIFVLSDNDKALEKGDLSFKLKKTRKEFYPFEIVLFAQIFAYNLSISKGLNPDLPRFLSKISKV
jgi:glucosamine--fructose-6-phosphate aminotransferase (isomerizing)